MEIAYAARVGHDLARAQQGLAAIPPGLSPWRKLTRLTGALFGRVIERGGLRLSRRMIVAGAFCDVDLDLREAELETPESSVTILVAFGNADVCVPEAIDVTVGGLDVFSRRREWGRDAARGDAPGIRVRAFSPFGTLDVWRASSDMRGDYADIFRQLQGHQRQLPE